MTTNLPLSLYHSKLPLLYNQWLKRMGTQFDKSTYQKSLKVPKVVEPTNKKTLFWNFGDKKLHFYFAFHYLSSNFFILFSICLNLCSLQNLIKICMIESNRICVYQMISLTAEPISPLEKKWPTPKIFFLVFFLKLKFKVEPLGV